uniref:Anthranilate synthase component 2 n=1 Tax=Caloglossa monosticha TaxID=76906 RepID=A0A1Z1M4W7_9FLOR|nr:Anthranilate synthase component II [Caloglossa monosticha]ARW60972.1 Anthranilate synthase component II [Caloglossa monosticha]
MILIIDNYDSFTHNLVQCAGELKLKIRTIRNDEISVNKIRNINPSHIILSPGPGNPQHSGVCLEILTNYAHKIPILGVCLGHQSIGYVYGAKIKQLVLPIHGKTSEIFHNKHTLFQEIPNPFLAARYHSLIIDEKNLPENLKIIAWTKDGTIMGCQHKIYPKLCGIQFHPESLWTCSGKTIIRNFLFF